MKRVLVAMSGGVDSSVTAWLLKEQGYDCIGATMKLYDNEMAGLEQGRTCCSLDDVEDARSVAWRMGMRHYTFNFKAEFENEVIRPFAESYLRGETPNPCIECNRCLKFDRLLRRAREVGCDYIATGHYARIEEKDGRFLLKKAADGSRDQSYVLYMLNQDQLAHTLFPLGGLHKTEVRRIAEEQGFVNARKQDSQDICFIPDGDYPAFLERYTGRELPPGRLVDKEGNTLGPCRNAAAYTIGQRRGLGLSADARRYVCGKSMTDNTVTVGPESDLMAEGLTAGAFNWIVPPGPEPFSADARVRYHQKEEPVTVFPQADGTVRMQFQRPRRAPAPGQAVVLYDGDVVLGGGIILRAER